MGRFYENLPKTRNEGRSSNETAGSHEATRARHTTGPPDTGWGGR